jgi:hypothetical protein
MKSFKSFLTEADTSKATKTEMAIVYAYNKIMNSELSEKELLKKGNMDAKKWSAVDVGTRDVGKKTAKEMASNSIGGDYLMHAGSSSAATNYLQGADTTSKADLYSNDSAQRFSLKATGGAQLMSAKSGEAVGVFNWGYKHCAKNNKEKLISDSAKKDIMKVLEVHMHNSSRNKMFVEVGKSKDIFADWFILDSKRDENIEKEFSGAGWNKYDTTKYMELKGKKYFVRDIDSKVKKGKTGNDWYNHVKAELQILNIVSGNRKKAQEKLFKFPSKDLLKRLTKNTIAASDVTTKDYKQLKPLTKKQLDPYYDEFNALGGAKIGDVKVSADNLKKIPPADLINDNLRTQIVDVIQIAVDSQEWKDTLVTSLEGSGDEKGSLQSWIVYEAASGYGKFLGKVSPKKSYSGGSGDSDNAVANKLLVFEKAGGVKDNKDIMEWSMENGSLINNMDISFKGSGTSRYIKFGVPTKGVKVESVLHEEAKSVLDDIIDNEFIKLEAEIYHLGQLDEGFLDYIKGTYNKAKDYAIAATNKLKEMVAKFYENVIKAFITKVGKWISKGLDFFMEMIGLEIHGNVSMSDASF